MALIKIKFLIIFLTGSLSFNGSGYKINSENTIINEKKITINNFD
jgi:hypothetical protein